MDYETIRQNDRIRGLANLGDNGALALFIAAVAYGLDTKTIDFWVIGAFALGFVLLWVTWNVRGLLQPEE